MSVAVHKLDSLSGKDPQDIKPYLWLTSDLKGVIESPEFYLNENDPVVKEAADNLMITHGWRRFKWEDIMANNLKREHIPEYRNHIINGKVASNGSSVEGNLTYLSVPGKMVRLFVSRSDAKGNVQYETNGLYGQQKFIVLASTSDSGVPAVEIKSPFTIQFTPLISKPFQLSPSQEKTLLSRAIAMQVQDVYYEDKTYQVMQTNLDSTSFYGKADETYYLDDYTRFPVMEEVLREYVPGVFVRKRKDGFHFIVINMVNGGVFEDEPMILLDGVPLFDADKIMTLDPLKIRKLEVVKRKYYLGALTMPGIVSFSTYKGDVAGIEMDPGTVSLNYEGLQLQREFYSPRYETQKQISSRLPDKRLLLYWNPKVMTDTNGNSQIEFYTSDVTGEFQIVIQGMTKSGAAASAVRNFTVK
jgi:hypothetical protein